MSEAVAESVAVEPRHAGPRPPATGRKKHRVTVSKKIKPAKVDEALTAAYGDRVVAAELLGITKGQLVNRIMAHDILRLKWTGAGMNAMKQMELCNSNRSIAEQQINVAYTTLGVNSQRILKQLKSVEGRIEKGEDARFLSDEQFIAKYNDLKLKVTFAFTSNDKGEPSEEAMLRETYLNLMEEFRKSTETFTDAAWVHAKVESILKGGKLGGRDSNPGGSKRTAGFGPKRAPTTPVVGVAVTVNNNPQPKSLPERTAIESAQELSDG